MSNTSSPNSGTVIKDTCKTVLHELDGLSKMISSEHQADFLVVLDMTIQQADYQLKYHSNRISDVDKKNLRTLRTNCAYIFNLVTLHFEEPKHVIGDERPDLVVLIDNLMDELRAAFGRTGSDGKPIDLTDLVYINAAAERFVRAYYNAVSEGAVKRVWTRITDQLGRSVKGTKG